jgi:hypothetical protein
MAVDLSGGFPLLLIFESAQRIRRRPSQASLRGLHEPSPLRFCNRRISTLLTLQFVRPLKTKYVAYTPEANERIDLRV